MYKGGGAYLVLTLTAHPHPFADWQLIFIAGREGWSAPAFEPVLQSAVHEQRDQPPPPCPYLQKSYTALDPPPLMLDAELHTMFRR